MRRIGLCSLILAAALPAAADEAPPGAGLAVHAAPLEVLAPAAAAAPDAIEAIARHHLAAVRAIQPQGPYFLAGRCFGGVVAMELAHQLTAAGEAVGLIFIFDATPEDFPELVPAEVLGRFQRGRLEQRVRSVATKLRPHRIWKGLPSLGQETLSTI